MPESALVVCFLSFFVIFGSSGRAAVRDGGGLAGGEAAGGEATVLFFSAPPHEKWGAPHLQRRRLPWQTPSKTGLSTANDFSRGVVRHRSW